jgi:hypothetical protein
MTKMIQTMEQAIEAAAKVAEKRAEERFAELGTREPDTNACYYEGRAAELLESLDEEDVEIAAAIRTLTAHIAASDEGQIEERARVLLALEYERAGSGYTGRDVREGLFDDRKGSHPQIALRAVAAALASTPIPLVDPPAKPTRMDEAWCIRMAELELELEGDAEIGAGLLAMDPAIPLVDPVREALEEVRFLLNRIGELDWSLDRDEFANDWHGHVAPSLSRLESAIRALGSPAVGEGGEGQ